MPQLPPRKQRRRRRLAETPKRGSLECAALVEDLLESSTSKKPRVTSLAVKKVPTRQDGVNSTFTISAIIDDK